MTDYKVYWDNGDGLGVFVVRKSTTTPSFTYTETSVAAGKAYSFKVSAVNVVGEGNTSSSGQFIAAQLPGTQLTPTLVSADSSP